MARLIILNGPPGVGKSTIAARLHKDISNSILLDIDEIRRSIPNYKEQRKESLILAYQEAMRTIEDCLAKDQTVIIDKVVSDSDTLDSFVEAGNKQGVVINEILLFADKESVQKRADERGYKPGSLLTRERVGDMWDQVSVLRRSRNNAVVMDTTHLNLEEVYENA